MCVCVCVCCVCASPRQRERPRFERGVSRRAAWDEVPLLLKVVAVPAEICGDDLDEVAGRGVVRRLLLGGGEERETWVGLRLGLGLG